MWPARLMRGSFDEAILSFRRRGLDDRRSLRDATAEKPDIRAKFAVAPCLREGCSFDAGQMGIPVGSSCLGPRFHMVALRAHMIHDFAKQQLAKASCENGACTPTASSQPMEWSSGT